MAWRRGWFRGERVWVEVDGAGRPAARGGRVAVRFRPDAGARLYRAGAARVAVDPDAPLEDLPEGWPAPGAGRGAPGAAAGRRSASGARGFGSAGRRTEAQAAGARRAAREAMEALPPGAVVAFTDGACLGNPGPAAGAAVLHLPDGRHLGRARFLGRATNQVGELAAVGVALDLLDEAGVAADAPVALFTDSRYAEGLLVRGWRARANRELVEALRGRLAERPGLAVRWLAGHVGIAGNEEVDVLARRAAEAGHDLEA